MPTPSEIPARDRWLALGLLLALLAMAYFVLVHSWWTTPMREAGARMASAQERGVRARQLVEQGPTISQRLQEMESRHGIHPGFMPEASPQQGVATLVQRVEQVVEQVSPGHRSCTITHRVPLAADVSERFSKVSLQVRLTCGNSELVNLLQILEAGEPRMFIDNLSMQPFWQGGGNDVGGGFDVSFNVTGYLRPEMIDDGI